MDTIRLQGKIDGSLYMTGGTDENGTPVQSLLDEHIKNLKPSDTEENPAY